MAVGKKEAEMMLELIRRREKHFEKQAKEKEEGGAYLDAAGFKLLRDGAFAARSDLWRYFREEGVKLKFD